MGYSLAATVGGTAYTFFGWEGGKFRTSGPLRSGSHYLFKVVVTCPLFCCRYHALQNIGGSAIGPSPCLGGWAIALKRAPYSYGNEDATNNLWFTQPTGVAVTHLFLQSIVCIVLLVEPCVWQSFTCMRKAEEADLEITAVVPSVHLEHTEAEQPNSTEQHGMALPGMVEVDGSPRPRLGSNDSTMSASRDSDNLYVPQASPARSRISSDNSPCEPAPRPSAPRDCDTLNVPQASPARSRISSDNSPCEPAPRPSAPRLSAARLSAHRVSLMSHAGLQRPSLATAQMPQSAEELFSRIDSKNQANASTLEKATSPKSLLPKGIGVPIFLCAVFSFMNNWLPSCH